MPKTNPQLKRSSIHHRSTSHNMPSNHIPTAVQPRSKNANAESSFCFPAEPTPDHPEERGAQAGTHGFSTYGGWGADLNPQMYLHTHASSLSWTFGDWPLTHTHMHTAFMFSVHCNLILRVLIRSPPLKSNNTQFSFPYSSTRKLERQETSAHTFYITCLPILILTSHIQCFNM